MSELPADADADAITQHLLRQVRLGQVAERIVGLIEAAD
jgi:hypothetical protein